MNSAFDGNGLNAKRRNATELVPRRRSMASATRTRLARVDSGNHRLSEMRCAKYASTMRPLVAADAAASATHQGLASGNRRPKNDSNIHVGGANAGSTFNTNTDTKSVNSEIIFDCVAAFLRDGASPPRTMPWQGRRRPGPPAAAQAPA